MDQIGKMYQNRAMVLQEQVNQLEQLLEAKGQEDPNFVSREQTAASKKGKPSTAPDSKWNPFEMAGDMADSTVDLAIEHPYMLGAGVATVLGGMQRFEKTAVLPNRILVDPKYASRPFLNMLSAWRTGETTEGQLPGPSKIKGVRPLNIGDRIAKAGAEAFNARTVKAAQDAADKAAADAAAKAAADDAAAKAAAAQAQAQAKTQAQAKAAAKDRFSNIKTGEIAAKIDETDPILRDQGTSLYDANGNIVQRGILTPEGIDTVVERQRKRYPDNPVTSKAIADMESGQMRQQAVSDPRLSPEVPAAPNRGGGNAAATAIDLPTMSGREVAGKLKGAAGNVLNVGGKFMDLPGEAASTLLGAGARAVGLGTAVGSGVGMLPAVIGLFDSPAYAPTIMPSPEEEAETMASINRYEEDVRKRNKDNAALEKSAMNPSGRFTPEPETQSERDERARQGLSQPVAVDMRRIAAKNGTRRGEYSTLQDRSQK